jgi:hypothetical protein
LALRFRPTVWPGAPVPIPLVSTVPEVRRDGRWLLLDLGGEMAEAPPEVYLRQFRDTPADDLDALVELCKLGWIRPLSAYQPYSDLPIVTDEQWERALADVDVKLWPGQPHWYGNEAERSEVERRSHSGFAVHAAEAALRVRVVQRATDHLLAHLDGKPVAPAWRDCEDDHRAWRNFVECTDAALRDFHVRVEVEVEAGGQPLVKRDPNEVYTTLYSAAMLQLVNDLAANETVRTCANETCHRRFVRQLGRSEYGGHRRSGTLYCSSNCARAQYQREKRRRDRAVREAVTVGQSGFQEAEEPKEARARA